MQKFQETELLLEISLSIGISLDLGVMLRHALTTVMRNLNCSAVQVFQHSRACSAFIGDGDRRPVAIEWSECFAFPKNISQNHDYQSFFTSLSLPDNCAALQTFTRNLPFTGIFVNKLYYILDLPKFGLLFLQKTGSAFEKDFLLTLQSVMKKLANAALACIDHELLQSQINEVKLKEAKLSTMLDSIGDAVIVVSPASLIIRMNPVAERLTGFSFNEVVGRNIGQVFRIINSLTREAVISPIDQALQLGRPVELANHTSLIRKDGTELQIADSCAPFFDGNGNITGVILIFRDVTAEYEQRERLRRSEQYNRLLLAAIPDLIFVFDQNGIFLNVQADEKQLLTSPDNFLGRHFSEVLPPDVSVILAENLARLFETRLGQAFHYSVQLGSNQQYFECRLVYMDEDRAMALSRDITERRQAEEALRVSEEKFRQITESMGEVFWLRSADNTRMLYVNPAYEKVWGRSCASLYASPQSFIDSVVAEDRASLLAAFETYMKTAEFNLDYRIVRPDGEVRWVNARSFPVRDQNNNIVRHTGFAVDITERRRVEEELARKSLELENYFTSSLDLLCIADLNGVFRRLNPEWEKCLGWSLNELIGSPFMDLVHPDDVASTVQAMQKLAGKNEVRNFVNRYRCKDCSYRFIQWRSTTTGDLIYAVARDITDSKNLEATLKRHDEIETFMAYLATMFINSSGEDIDVKINFALENIGRLLEVDRVYVFQYSEDLALCSNTYEWCNEGIEPQIQNLQDVPNDALPWWTEKMRNLQSIMLNSLDELPPEAAGEREILEPQGIKSIMVVPLAMGGKVDGFIGFDSVRHHKKWTHEEASPLELLATIIVSARRRREDDRKLHELNSTLERRVEKRTKELQKAQSQLYLQDKMVSIGQLAAGLAHEINNPVSFVATNFVTLEENLTHLVEIFREYRDAVSMHADKIPELKIQHDKLVDKEKEVMVEYILKDLPELFKESKDGFRRITEIINGMRTFARHDSVEEWVDYNLNDGIRETLIIARNAYKYNASLALELGNIPSIRANPGQINQVLLNIIVNAAQAIGERSQDGVQGLIQIRTWHDSGIVHCEISDNGPGIPEGQLSRIFDPFFSTKEPGKGTGLGLSISFDIIVNKHKGQMSVSNRESGGACFLTSLPVR